MMISQLWWYSARAGGLVAWALLTASVLWGLVLSAKLKPPRTRPAWTLDLHRYLGGLATIFVGIHVGSIILDSYTHFGLSDVLVPFASQWHPLAVAWGIVGFYLVLAVELTSLARRSLPQRTWRRLHMLAFPLWLFATVHFATAGTDAKTAVARVAMIGAAAGVCALTGVRVEEHLWKTRSRASQVRSGGDRRRSDGLVNGVVARSARP
jgi:DMSO/TMAO reductase YedYZ heme-binding membrane subunit